MFDTLSMFLSRRKRNDALGRKLESPIWLEFNAKTATTNEERIALDINHATEEIAGSGKGISNVPLTLVVRKNGVLDLPGITRAPVHGQLENICDQNTDMIMEYIRPEESIILNVLSASVDFTTFEPIRMSQQVDKTRVRTLAMVTKANKAPEELQEKVYSDDVNIQMTLISALGISHTKKVESSNMYIYELKHCKDWVTLAEEEELSIEECAQFTAARHEYLAYDKAYAQDIRQKARVKWAMDVG